MKKIFKIIVFILAISFMSGCACRTCKTYHIVVKKHKPEVKCTPNYDADEVDNF